MNKTRITSVFIAMQSSLVAMLLRPRRCDRFNLTRDYTVRLLNEAIARCDGQDIRH